MTDIRKLKQEKSNRRKKKIQDKGSARDEFRKKNKDSNGHPNYIYRKVGNNYEYIGMTHSPITRGIKNIELDKNPNPKDKEKAYLKPTPERASKKDFKNHTEDMHKEMPWLLITDSRNLIRSSSNALYLLYVNLSKSQHFLS